MGLFDENTSGWISYRIGWGRSVMNNKIMVGMVAAALCSVLLSVGSAATSEQLEQRALDAMTAGQYPQAAGLWQEFLKRNPGQPVALYNLACCHSRNGDLDLAAQRLEEAYEAGMSDPELVRTDPDLEALRESRKGRALIERLAAEAEESLRLRGAPGTFEAPVLGGFRVVVPRDMKEGRKYPLVMILHGHGANPENYVGTFERVASSLEAIVCAPYGPYPIPFERGHGYSWYPAPWFFRELLGDRNVIRRSRATPQGNWNAGRGRQPGLRSCRHRARLGRFPVDPDRVFLMGHSEGGVLAYGLALERPDLFRGLVVVGSRLRESDATEEILTEAAGRLEVMICHSRGDQAISFDFAKKAAAALKSAGVQNKIYAYEGGHGFTAELARTIGSWIAARCKS